MSRQKDKSTQAEPTAPRDVDAAGRELDAFGLPFSGPARVLRLSELKMLDPNIEPEAWASAPSSAVLPTPDAPATKTETNND